jgi:chemosensory pili system protein ChpC
MDNQSEQMRGILITVPGGKLLLPNATVSEIITFASPESVEEKPDWYLGALRWKGYRLPLVSFSAMAGWSQGGNHSGSKVAILKGLSGDHKLPYYALLTLGFPRLVNISSDHLIDDPEHSNALFFTAYLDNDAVTVPNLEAFEQQIREHL